MALHPIRARIIHDVSHGFFTRIGGVSTGEFSSLNCGYGSPESRQLIAKNRSLISSYFRLETNRLLSVKQTHSANVITFGRKSDFAADLSADAMVTNVPNLGLGILTADCAPVLFWDKENRIVGAAHAGWRGAIGGVLEATIAAMCELGAKRGSIVAAVGPCIGQKCYEVGQEFFEEFIIENRSNSKFFANSSNKKYLFNLPAFVLERLKQSSISGSEWTGQCTYSEPSKFYSYRYSQHNNLPSYGRLLSVIAI